jgi:hypothetical protein
MCHQRFWSLGCGHPCFIDKFCPDSFEEPGTHIRHLCLNATARPGTPGSEDAVCRQPLCPYGKDSWRCCACGGWNNEIAECSNVMSPEVDAHHSEDDGNPHGIDQTPLCPHHRCAVCTAGPAGTLLCSCHSRALSPALLGNSTDCSQSRQMAEPATRQTGRMEAKATPVRTKRSRTRAVIKMSQETGLPRSRAQRRRLGLRQTFHCCLHRPCL